MKLRFRQRLLSWFDSYDIYAEDGSVAYVVRGKPAWGHKLLVYDPWDQHIATLREQVLRLTPQYEVEMRGQRSGTIRQKLTFLRPKYVWEPLGWSVEGNFTGWDYTVQNSRGHRVMSAYKELLKLTDTYVIDVDQPENALSALMVVLAIDASKCR